MSECPPQLYNRIVPLVKNSGMHNHLALVYEVLEGRRPGEVFVDSLPDPQTALICNANGFYFGFGRPDRKLVRPLVEKFWKQNLGLNYATLFGSTPDWKILLKSIAPPESLPEARLGFEQRHPAPQPVIPAGLSLAPISAHLAQSILDGSGTAGFGIDPWFIRVAGGPAAYAADGLGLALLVGEQIVSLCGVCGLGGGEAEMEVGTVLAYRGRGLAPIVCAAFMDQAKSRGILPAYTCSSDNLASKTVAHKLGFVEHEEIHGYRLFK